MSLKEPFEKVKNAPPEVFRDRILLFSIILATWLSIKILEKLLPDRVLNIFPGPLPLGLLFLVIGAVLFYTVVVYVAQQWKNFSARLSAHVSEQFPKQFSDRVLPLLGQTDKKSNVRLGESSMGQDHQDQADDNNSYYPAIDVFVPCHNEKNVILDTIQNLLQIDYASYHIYIIDDRSIDGSADRVDDFIKSNNLSKKVSLIRRVDGQPPGKSASLNQALSMTSSELVAVFDADAKVQSHCFKEAIKYFENSKVGGVQFQKRINNASFNTLAKCQDLEFAFDTFLQVGRDSLNGLVEFRGNGQVNSRKCLLEVGGWDERTLTDDLELSTRLYVYGWRIRFIPEVEVYEEGVITPTALFKQRRRWAEGSIRRYLTHFQCFVTPKGKIKFLQRFDIVPFMCQFAIPIWIFLDLVLESISFFRGEATHITTLMLATLSLSLVFIVNISISIRRWRGYSAFNSFKYGLLTFFYGSAHWPIIVLWTVRKVLFGRRPTQWNKTPRMVDLIEAKNADF
ncbi:MAG: glycosyltransferase [Candidatus Melainabacteria bacterium]|jgi:1,2-diacylglycerol 3-beta-glucosyltransferase